MDTDALHDKVMFMEPAEAMAQLETIRTLMERTALYRRALGPISLGVGVVGTVAAVLGIALPVDAPAGFVGLWLGAAVASVSLAFVVARRQALGDGEPFWTPPTRRIAGALLPPLVAGAALSIPALAGHDWSGRAVWWLPALWMVLYGCALQAAGFFIRRGMRLLGWAYVLAGIANVLWSSFAALPAASTVQGHLAMGLAFGVGHLAQGVYLQCTEHRPAP
jgi:hypothetical protein